jgi:hypothetical protein
MFEFGRKLVMRQTTAVHRPIPYVRVYRPW